MFLTKHYGVVRRRYGYDTHVHIIQQLVFIEIHDDSKQAPRVHFFFNLNSNELSQMIQF